MARTRLRPTASGRIEPAEALAVGVTLAIISVMLMGLALNWLAAALLALTIAFYVFVYTMWLKRRTPQNIVIGGAAGRSAADGGVGRGDRRRRACCRSCCSRSSSCGRRRISGRWRCTATGDYDRVGVPMLPVVAGRRSTLRPHPGLHRRAGSGELVPVALGLAGLVYGAAGARARRRVPRLRRPALARRIAICWRCAPSATRSSTCSRCSPAFAVDRAVQDLLLS